MRGLIIALENFYKGACTEGYNAAMKTADPERSWQICERADWMLWMLRPVRDVVRVFEDMLSEIDPIDRGDYGPKSAEEQEIRIKFLEYGANALRKHLPNPFSREGYEWLMKGEQKDQL